MGTRRYQQNRSGCQAWSYAFCGFAFVLPE
jgi:hypothetical protein